MRILLTFLLMLALVVALCAAQQDLIQRHVSNRELQTRAGYFDASTGFYMGGVPDIGCVHRFDDNDCQRTTAGNKTYCSYWHITQSGGGSSSDGNCKCTQGSVPNNTHCLSYFCAQTVTTTTTCGGTDEAGNPTSYMCISTFDKYKLCRCTKPDPFGRFCSRWQCLGYNDGPIKTANWFCRTLASEEIGVAADQDYCYTFGSDQYSDDVQEAKDCVCTQDGGTYCAHWVCEDRIYKIWPWWTPIVASLVGAVLNMWVPNCTNDKLLTDCGMGCGIAWCIISYLEIVMVGGVPSLIANSVALLAAWCFSYRDRITWCYCYCSARPRDVAPTYPSAPRVSGPQEQSEMQQVVVGTVIQ